MQNSDQISEEVRGDSRAMRQVLSHQASFQSDAGSQITSRKNLRAGGLRSTGVSMDSMGDDWEKERGEEGEHDSLSGDSAGGQLEEGEGEGGVAGGGDRVERRVKLDRRKIESFFNEHQISCQDFLTDVKLMNQVKIGGISGLSFGQRLKRDPFIKISGKPLNVERAKNAIIQKLASKTGNNAVGMSAAGGIPRFGMGGAVGGVGVVSSMSGGGKVVLKVDIGHGEHSHIIGKSGNSIKAVMERTQCHIHFPDSNRTNSEEKSNQVSISGLMHNVELARTILRDMQQLELSFELPLTTVLHSTLQDSAQDSSRPARVGPGGAPDLSNPIVQKIGQKYEINISVDKSGAGFAMRGGFDQLNSVGRGENVNTIVYTTKGSVSNTEKVKCGTQELMDYLTQNYTAPIAVQTTVDVSPQHQAFVFGKDRYHIQRIINKTNCLVSVPDPLHTPNLPASKRGTVYIQGNIDSVVTARKMLIAHLPVVFLFDASMDLASRQEEIEATSLKYDCQVHVKYRARQQTSNVVVKTFEKNIAVCYEIRRELGFPEETNPAGEPSMMAQGYRMHSMPMQQQTSGSHAGGQSLFSQPSDVTIPLPMPLMSQVKNASSANHSARMAWPAAPFSSLEMQLPTSTSAHMPSASIQSQWHQELQRMVYQQAMLNSMLQSSMFPQLGVTSTGSNKQPQQPFTSDLFAPAQQLTPDQLLLLQQLHLYNNSSVNMTPNATPLFQGVPAAETCNALQTFPISHVSSIDSNLSDSPPDSGVQRRVAIGGRMLSAANQQQRRRNSRENPSSLKVPTEHSGDERCSVSSDNASSTSPDKVSSSAIDSNNNHQSETGSSLLSPHASASNQPAANSNANPAATGLTCSNKFNTYAECVSKLLAASTANSVHNTDKQILPGIDQGSFNASLNNNSSNGGSNLQSSFNAGSMEALNQSLADIMMRAVSGSRSNLAAESKDDNNNSAAAVASLNGDQPRSSVSSFANQTLTQDNAGSGHGNNGGTPFNESKDAARHILTDSAIFSSLLLEQDKKRLAAQCAIEQDVGSRPELRFPNPLWAGLGFSRSMPHSSLKGIGVREKKSSKFNPDSVFEEEETPMYTNKDNNANASLSPRDPFKDDVIHPSDPSQKVSKHGAPGDKPPTSLPLATFNSAVQSKSSLFSAASPIGQFAQSNQVDVLSKLYKRSVPLNAFSAMPFGRLSAKIDENSEVMQSAGHVAPKQETVAEVLRTSGLSKYIDLFREQEIFDMETFLSLTESDLKDLGITFGARRKLELEIKSRKMGRLQPVQEQLNAKATINPASLW